jgi:hypothetical protein
MFFPEIGAGKVGRLTLGMFLARKKRSRNCETLINVDTYSFLVMKKAGLTF